jgi:tRNA nucleotidyltransferase/poly(A) polymerase
LETRLEPDFLAHAVQAAARDAGAEWAAVVGGYVRNRLMDEPSADLDLVVPSHAAAVAGRIADSIGGHVVPLSRWRQWQIFHKTWRVDVTEAADLEEDLARRDFTVNAIAWRLLPPSYELLDPLGGREDLAAGRLDLCRPDAFVADPARLIRAARLVAFGLRPTDDLTSRASDAVTGLTDVPMERVWREWRRMASGPQAGAALRFVVATGIAQAWLGIEVNVGPGGEALLEASGTPPSDGPGPGAVALALLDEVRVDRATWLELARRVGCTRAEASAAEHRSSRPSDGS